MSRSSSDRMVEAKQQIEQIKRDLDLSNDDMRSVHGLMMRDQALRSSSPPPGRNKR